MLNNGKWLDSSSFITATASGNSSTTVFTLPSTPIGADALWVFVNGLEYEKTTDYSLSGANVTFVSAPVTGQKINFKYIKR